MLNVILTVFMLLVALPAWAATTRYVATTGSDAVSCATSATIGTPKRNLGGASGAIACMAAGDTLYVRAGTYTESEPLRFISKTGSLGSEYTVSGYQSEVVTLAPSTGSRAIIVSGCSYIILTKMVLDGINGLENASGQNNIEYSNHITVLNAEIKRWHRPGIYILNSDFITIKNNLIHDQIAPTNAGRYYGLYIDGSASSVVEGNEIYSNQGGGIQVYNGQGTAVTGLTIRRNYIHDNNSILTATNIGGIIVMRPASVGAISGLTMSTNIIANNGSATIHGGAPGITLAGTLSNTTVVNNTFYNNHSASDGSSAVGYGILIQSFGGLPTGTVMSNNLVTGNQVGSILTNGATVTSTYNACLTGESCGSTGKLTITALTSCTVSTSDFTQKAGSSCVNQGTPISGYAYNASNPDIGAFETVGITGGSATINDATLDVTLGMNLNTPVRNLVAAQWTVGCTGSNCGTPVVTNATLKSGTDSVVRLTLSGLGGSAVCEVGQTWTVTATATGATDSALIGNATNQPITAIAASAVTNACTGGGTPPPTGPHISYLLDDNTGTNANDATANNLDGTLTGTTLPTWVTGHTGSAVSFADSTTERYIAVPYGNALNPSSTSLSVCLGVLPHSTSSPQKIVFSSNNGTSQRFYIGWIGGTWGIGIQASGFATGSEFPLVANWTRLCLVADSATDIATLYVNGVKGTSARVVKSYTSYVLASNFRLGSETTFPENYGGSTIDDFKLWTSALTDQDVADDYLAWEPVTPVVGTFTQKTHQFYEARYLTGTSTTVALGSAGGAINVAIGQSFAVVTQTDCTGANCDPIGQRLHYSRNGGPFLPVPDNCADDFICFFGETADPDVLNGTVTCCLTGALTPLNGSTQRTANAVPIYDLAQNASTVHRRVLKVDNSAVLTDTYDFKEYNQTGTAFTTYDPVGGARITIASGISAPTNLHLAGAASSTSAALVWSAVTSTNTSGYHLYASTTSGVQGTLVATVTTASSMLTHMPPTTWHAHTLPSGTQYVVVRAFDLDGNESAATSEVSVTVAGQVARTARTP